MAPPGHLRVALFIVRGRARPPAFSTGTLQH